MAVDGTVRPSARPTTSLKFLMSKPFERKTAYLLARSLDRSTRNTLNLRSFSHLVINLLEITPSGQADMADMAPVEAFFCASDHIHHID